MEKHFFNTKLNSIKRDGLKKLEGEKSKTLFKNSKEIPSGDNIMLFQGILSQNFTNGDKSRNGYKYDQNGWDLDNYSLLPLVLWQHNDSYGGIGFMQEAWLDTNENLVGLFYVDLDMLEDRNRKQVEKGFVKGISTGAITKEFMLEDNETGKRYSKDEAEDKFGWENVWNAFYGATDAVLTYVVTKAELVENSLVTIGSNFGAIAKSVNGLDSEMKSIANQMKSQKDATLISNNSNKMNLEELQAEHKSLQDKFDVSETNGVEKDSKIEALNTEVNTLKKDTEEKETEINSLKDSITAKDTELNKFKEDSKNLVLANANIKNDGKEGGNEEAKEVNTMQDFSKKHLV